MVKYLSRKAQWPLSLGDLDLFADCSPSQLEQIASLLTMLSVDPGAVLINEGAIGAEFMVIAGGDAVVTVKGVPVAHLGAGDFMGEMSLLAHSVRSATVTAETPLTFYVCNRAEFSSLLEAAPSVAEKINAAATARAAANSRKAA